MTVINGTTVVATVSVGNHPDGLAYDSANGTIYVANAGTDNVSVVSGTTVVATIPVQTGPGGIGYDGGNGYAYVANFGSNNVSVISGRTVIATIPVGMGPAAVVYDSGNGYVYIANYGSNTTSVISTTTPPRGFFPVTFTETGLPAGTSWSVALNGPSKTSTTTTITFYEPNGTYSYAVGGVPDYIAAPASGSVTVSGAPLDATISFASRTTATDAVTFTGTGLPVGTSWSVTLNGSSKTSTTTTITFPEPNGTYSFVVGSVVGYTAYPSSGSVTLSGAPVGVTISFTSGTAVTYTVTFTGTGLPSGSSWSVTLGGDMMSSISGTIAFTKPNGTYTFSIGTVPGYSASPSSGTLTVNGRAVGVSISFAAVAPPSFLGLPAMVRYAVLTGVVTALVAFGIGLGLRRRRKKRTV